MILWSHLVCYLMFMLGLYGLVTNSSNLIQMLMSLEMLLLSLLLNFSFTFLLHSNIMMLMVSVLMTVMAASESALGLTIVVYFYKISGSMAPSNLLLLKN